jgi:CDP-paratose 2-epimerase
MSPLRLLLTGACGFLGKSLIQAIREAGLPWDLLGFDNLSRPGSETNRAALRSLGVPLVHGDLRCPSDVEALPAVDWIVDCAANPSVLAGADGVTSSRQLVEHNLAGTVNLLEHCRATRAGFVLFSTSRVYSIPALAGLPIVVREQAFDLAQGPSLPEGVTIEGIAESFSTAAPISLYGATKLASEALALEYGGAFDFPVWINRCGVLAGAGQFGRADQGIFSYWLNSHLRREPLKYIGFDGLGHQVRDCLHPRDLLPLLQRQLAAADDRSRPRMVHVGGGRRSSLSLRQMTDWCDSRFGPHPVERDPRPRRFDLPWVVLDTQLAAHSWGWQPATSSAAILEEIAVHAEAHPDWLQLSASN